MPENPKTAFVQTQVAVDILTFMITNAPQIFTDENPSTSQHTKTHSLPNPLKGIAPHLPFFVLFGVI
jgi:hypothetical protein